MLVNLQAEGSADKLPEGMSTEEIREAQESRRILRQTLREEQLALHLELTRREHADAEARRNPNASLNQGVSLRG